MHTAGRVDRKSSCYVKGVSRTVVAGEPLLNALSIVFQGGVISLGARAFAFSRHVDIALCVDGYGVRAI
jgi:hypothetical protein